MSSSARAVIRPGSPGPAPTRYAVPRSRAHRAPAGRAAPGARSRCGDLAPSASPSCRVDARRAATPSRRAAPTNARSDPVAPIARGARAACGSSAPSAAHARALGEQRMPASRSSVTARRRSRGRVAGRASSASAPWPAARHERSLEHAADSASRPSRLSPAAASTSASTSPAASLRSRVSTLPRSSTTSRSGRAGAAAGRARRSDAVPTRAPAAARPATRADQHVERVLARRRGDELGARRRSSPGTSLAECTARSISPASSARSSSLDPARLVPRARSGVARGRDRDEPSSPPSTRGDRRAPARARARSRACRSAACVNAAAAGARRRRPLGARPSSRRRSSRPNSSRRTCRRRVAAAPASGALQAQRRLVQQPLHDRARDGSTRARSRVGQRPPSGRRSRRAPGRRSRRRGARSAAIVGMTSSEPSHSAKRLDLLLDDRLGARAPRPRGP